MTSYKYDYNDHISRKPGFRREFILSFEEVRSGGDMFHFVVDGKWIGSIRKSALTPKQLAFFDAIASPQEYNPA